MVLAVLDGIDVDSGTAAEIGYAFARDKPILGYRSDFRLSADNEGSMVNLQVEYFIRQSGGDISRRSGACQRQWRAFSALGDDSPPPQHRPRRRCSRRESSAL